MNYNHIIMLYNCEIFLQTISNKFECSLLTVQVYDKHMNLFLRQYLGILIIKCHTYKCTLLHHVIYMYLFVFILLAGYLKVIVVV